MTPFKEVYKQFLATVEVDFGDLTNEEIELELQNWVIIAASLFKFPYIDLSHKEIEEDGKVAAVFINTITQKEITVILAYMQTLVIKQQLLAAKRYDAYYNDANLKMPSQSAMLTQLNRSLENETISAQKVENDYYRTRGNKPTVGDVWTT